MLSSATDGALRHPTVGKSRALLMLLQLAGAGGVVILPETYWGQCEPHISAAQVAQSAALAATAVPLSIIYLFLPCCAMSEAAQHGQ